MHEMDFKTQKHLYLSFNKFQWVSTSFSKFQQVSASFSKFRQASTSFNKFQKDWTKFHHFYTVSYGEYAKCSKLPLCDSNQKASLKYSKTPKMG